MTSREWFICAAVWLVFYVPMDAWMLYRKSLIQGAILSIVIAALVALSVFVYRRERREKIRRVQDRLMKSAGFFNNGDGTWS